MVPEQLGRLHIMQRLTVDSCPNNVLLVSPPKTKAAAYVYRVLEQPSDEDLFMVYTTYDTTVMYEEVSVSASVFPGFTQENLHMI